MAVQKNDFIELEFVAKANKEVFDTNRKEEAEKIGMKQVIPMIISVGRGMVIKGLDQELEGKEIGKEYVSTYKPELAFGKRDPKMVRMIPLKIFLQQKIMPEKGMQLSLDGMLVRVLSVSGGRVLVDFNNPLSGKDVEYSYIIKKKIDDINEKINALQDFFFRNRFEFKIADKDLIFIVDENVNKFIQLFEKQFEEALGLKLKFEAKKPAEEKKEAVKTETNSQEKK
jgi:FKBP-type peptidyl-prolyl cis-trans isomerase SlyD